MVHSSRTGYSNLAREIHFPEEFISNRQTHLSMLISVSRIIRTSQVGEFDQGWSKTLLSRARFEYHWSRRCTAKLQFLY